MITTSKREQRRGVLPVALMLSLLFNLVAGSVVTYLYGFDRIARFFHLKSEMPEREVALSQAITITHRSVPVPTPARHAAAPRRVTAPAARPKVAVAPHAVVPVPVPAPTAHPVATPHPIVHHHSELARVRPHSIAMAPHSDSATTTKSDELPSPSKSIAVPKQTAVNGRSESPSEHGAESSRIDIAKLEGQFSKTIAQAQAENDPIRVSKVAPQTMKHYGMQFSGIHANLSPGEGYIEPISQQRIGGTMWYYTHYEYMYADGSVEEDDIPWPFHYPVNNDPFARGERYIDLEPPPVSYTPNRPLKLQLQAFFPHLYPDAREEIARKASSG